MSKSLFESLSPKQTFIGGLVGGILVLCTIGFFIMLGMSLGGDGTTRTVKNTGTTGTVANGDVAGPKTFTQCLDSGKYADAVRQDFQTGASLGVNGTPATFINGVLLSGALPYDAIKQVIDATLAGRTPDFDFLRDQQTGEIVKVTMPDLPNPAWLGNPSATVSVVEFSDFECPFCARFAPSVKQMLAEYGDRVRFDYRHFPLSFHANAQKAAEAYECAKEQSIEKGYEMHDRLFELQATNQLTIANYKRIATEIGLK